MAEKYHVWVCPQKLHLINMINPYESDIIRLHVPLKWYLWDPPMSWFFSEASNQLFWSPSFVHNQNHRLGRTLGQTAIWLCFKPFKWLQNFRSSCVASQFGMFSNPVSFYDWREDSTCQCHVSYPVSLLSSKSINQSSYVLKTCFSGD